MLILRALTAIQREKAIVKSTFLFTLDLIDTFKKRESIHTSRKGLSTLFFKQGVGLHPTQMILGHNRSLTTENFSRGSLHEIEKIKNPLYNFLSSIVIPNFAIMRVLKLSIQEMRTIFTNKVEIYGRCKTLKKTRF